nr:IPT/TIG domain-containing protein [Pleurocapsa sp. MO_226.B13]
IRSKTEYKNSTIYTAQEQTADFGGIQLTITVKVAQVSSDVGTGSYATATLTPELVEPAPTITSFAPASGLIGATITVTGTDLAQVSEIKIGDIIQDNLAVIDNAQVSFAIAPGTVSGLIELTTTGGTAISSNALIIEQPPQALVFPIASPITLPYTITPNDAGAELVITGESGVLAIPDSEIGFAMGWGCWISLDGTGTVTIERESGGTNGILGNNALGDNQTVKLWYRGNNIWKLD